MNRWYVVERATSLIVSVVTCAGRPDLTKWQNGSQYELKTKEELPDLSLKDYKFWGDR